MNEKKCLVISKSDELYKDVKNKVYLNLRCYNKNITPQILSNSNFIKPYGLTEKEREEDSKELDRLINVFSVDITEQLNKYHNKNYSQRYWEILVGPWLKSFISVILYKYNNIKNALKDETLSSIIVSKKTFYNKNNDFKDFIDNCNSDEWNYNLNSEIFFEFKSDIITIIKDYVSSNKKDENNIQNKLLINQLLLHRSPKKLNSTIIHFIKNILIKFSSFFKKENQKLILHNYISLFSFLKINFYLKQFPVIFRSPKINYLPYSSYARENINLSKENISGLEKYLRKIIPRSLPTSVVENYKNIANKVQNYKSWPKNPKLIFTTNDHHSNEFFKFWTGEKIESKSVYVVGQHGTNYFTYKDYLSYTDMRTCDYFISWGNQTQPKKNISAFNLLNINIKQNHNIKNKIFFFLKQFPNYNNILSWDNYFEVLNGYRLLNKTIDSLEKNVIKKIILRTGFINNSRDISLLKNFLTKYKELKFDYREIKNHHIYNISDLNIYYYDSTGFLESLSLNHPCLVFLTNGLNFYNNETKENYKKLINANIMFEDPIKMSNHINNLSSSNKLLEWWNSKEIISIKSEISQILSKPKPENPEKKLAIILENCHKNHIFN